MFLDMANVFGVTFTSLSLLCVCWSQRPPFAGSRPIGYPEISTEAAAGLADRFGEVDGTTQRLPIEALGDRDLVNRLSKLPVDKQPFWFINWQALEENRKRPQTYPLKPNPFVDPVSGSGQSMGSGSVGQSETQNRFGTAENSANNSNTVGSVGLTTSAPFVNKHPTISSSNNIPSKIDAINTNNSGTIDGLVLSSDNRSSSDENVQKNKKNGNTQGKEWKNNYAYF